MKVHSFEVDHAKELKRIFIDQYFFVVNDDDNGHHFFKAMNIKIKSTNAQMSSRTDFDVFLATYFETK